MVKRILEMNKGTLKSQKYFQIKYFSIIIILMMLPIVFISNSMVIDNNYMLKFVNIFDGVLNNITRASEVSMKNDFYYKIKFQYVYSLCIMVPVSIFMIFDFAKVYLCSLGIIKNSKEVYNIEGIQKNKVDDKFSKILYGLLFTLIVFEVCYLGSIGFIYSDTFFDSIYTSYLFSFGGTYVGFSFAYLVVEFFAHILKLYFNIKKKLNDE